MMYRLAFCFLFLFFLSNYAAFWPTQVLFLPNTHFFIQAKNSFTLMRDKKNSYVNGKKVVNGQNIKISSCMVNGSKIYEMAYFYVTAKTIKGYIVFSKKQVKKNYILTICDYLYDIQTIKTWHAIEKETSDFLQQTFKMVNDKNVSLTVRVLLAACDISENSTWKFFSKEGFLIKHAHDKQKINYCNNVTIIIKKGSLFCNGKRLKGAIKLKPRLGYGTFNEKIYDGDFVFVPYKNTYLCINYVKLEDYIVSVLKTESWPGWPLEVNKVFAITCRSYVASKILEAKKMRQPYHVKNTNEHQTYQGKHDVAILKQAVELTRGIVLGFEQKPILAMFDSCCGGIIPAHIADVDFDKAPYLARNYACNYCKSCSLYSWKVDYKYMHFENIFKKNYKELQTLHDIAIIKKDKAGLVNEIALKGTKNNVIISGKKLYSMFKEIKSFRFNVTINRHTKDKQGWEVMFIGDGYGHHLGLCQWGARQMVRHGFDYKSILQFYYPNTYFMKLA